MQVISVTPTDPQALAKLGELYDNEGDKSQAFQYYYEVKVKNAVTFFFSIQFFVRFFNNCGMCSIYSHYSTASPTRHIFCFAVNF